MRSTTVSCLDVWAVSLAVPSALPLAAPLTTLLVLVRLEEMFFPRVSGRATMRKIVSSARRTNVSAAGSAYTLSSMPEAVKEGGRGRDAKYAPMGGPMQKHIANAIPTCAKAFARVSGVVTSDKMALRG